MHHQIVSDAIEFAGSRFVSVTFTKKDGTERQLTWNPRHIGEIKGTGHVTQDPNIFRVVDIKLGQWRSFDARRVTQIKVAGQVFL